MTMMSLVTCGVVIVVFFMTGSSQVKATTVTASITPNPSRRGSIRKHTVRCDVTLSHYDNIGSITLALLTPESSSEASGIATVLHYSGRSRQQWETDSHLKHRGTLDGSVEEGYIALRLRDTLCSDDNQGYKCIVMYYRDAVWKTAVSTTTQSVRGCEPDATNVSVSFSQDPHLTVRCGFHLHTGYSFRTLYIDLLNKNYTRSHVVAGFYLYHGHLDKYWGAHVAPAKRETLEGSLEDGYFAVRFRNTDCSDDGKSYKCTVQGVGPGPMAFSADDAITVSLKGC